MLNVLLWIVAALQGYALFSLLVRSSQPGALRGGMLAVSTIMQLFMIAVTVTAAIVV